MSNSSGLYVHKTSGVVLSIDMVQLGPIKVAVFPNVSTELGAATSLFDAKNNSKFGGTATLADLIRSNSPKRQNDTAGMIRDIPPAAGLKAMDKWSNLTTEQRQAFVAAYARREGWHG